MAQHIELLGVKDFGDSRTNRDISRVISSIENDFSKGLSHVSGSLKYSHEDFHKEYVKDGEKDTIVFLRKMKVYSGKENGSLPSVLEIHYDVTNKKIAHIYLVI